MIVGKVFILLFSNEDMDNIFTIVKLLEELGAIMAPMSALLIAPMASSSIQPVPFSLINAISGKGFMRARKTARMCISSIISITFNVESFGIRSHKSKKNI